LGRDLPESRARQGPTGQGGLGTGRGGRLSQWLEPASRRSCDRVGRRAGPPRLCPGRAAPPQFGFPNSLAAVVSGAKSERSRQGQTESRCAVIARGARTHPPARVTNWACHDRQGRCTPSPRSRSEVEHPHQQPAVAPAGEEPSVGGGGTEPGSRGGSHDRRRDNTHDNSRGSGRAGQPELNPPKPRRVPARVRRGGECRWWRAGRAPRERGGCHPSGNPGHRLRGPAAPRQPCPRA